MSFWRFSGVSGGTRRQRAGQSARDRRGFELLRTHGAGGHTVESTRGAARRPDGRLRTAGHHRQAGAQGGGSVESRLHRRVHSGILPRYPKGAGRAASSHQGIGARGDGDDQLRDAHVRPERASSGALRRLCKARGFLSDGERGGEVQGGTQALQEREGLGAVPPWRPAAHGPDPPDSRFPSRREHPQGLEIGAR